MSEPDLSGALAEWRKCVGEERVVSDPSRLREYSASVGGERREVHAVLYPASTSEVQRIVEIANEFLAPVYPVSTGKNWGLGSRLPARDGAVIVDLHRMNRIHEVNVPLHYAIVEAGVTQGQLYDHLRQNNLPLLLNVTGSGLGTSLIANALERGVGYFSGRAESLSGLEVVLGNGKVIQTGCGHFPGSVTTHVNRHGVGPSLDGLFAQSNFGIVTRAGIDLIPKRARHIAAVCRLHRAEDVGELVERLADLRRRDLVQTAVHIANRDRTMISLGPLLFRQLVDRRGYPEGEARVLAAEMLQKAGFGAWSAVGGLMGTAGQLREARRALRRAMRGLGRVVFLDDRLVSWAKRLAGLTGFVPWVRRQEDLLLAVEPLYNLSKGVPSDEALKSVFWPVTGEAPAAGTADPDQGVCGLLYCLPMIPMSGAAATEMMSVTGQVCEKRGFTPYVTMNMVGSKALECVINIAFNRSKPEEVSQARLCMREMQNEFLKRGLIPYRVGIDLMDTILDENDPYCQTVRDLKRAVDPNGIIAPGRYNLV